MKTQRSRSRGFSLVELLLSTVLIVVVMAALASILVSHLGTTDRQGNVVQVRRELARFSYLLGTEVNEACALQRASDPSGCLQTCTTATTTDLRILIPVLQNGTTATTRVIRYYLSGTTIMREGPRILANGQLETTTGSASTTALVLDSVASYTAQIDADCHAATIFISQSLPSTTQTSDTTFSVRTSVEAL
jgi:type II secretory pathway pseudopilin PulG